VQLTFTDSGEGIDMKKYGAKLFTPFIPFNTQQQGKGIGLFNIKKMIEKNGGRIEVESEPGKGTSFIILPEGIWCSVVHPGRYIMVG